MLLPAPPRQWHARSPLSTVLALAVFTSSLPYGDSATVRYPQRMNIVIDCSTSRIHYLVISRVKKLDLASIPKTKPVMQTIASFHKPRTL